MTVIVTGSAVFGGLVFFGPFNTVDDAASYARTELPKTHATTWEIAQLNRSNDCMNYKAKPE